MGSQICIFGLNFGGKLKLALSIDQTAGELESVSLSNSEPTFPASKRALNIIGKRDVPFHQIEIQQHDRRLEI